MKQKVLFAFIAALTLTVAQSTAAQDVASSIVGTWKIKSQVRKEIESGATANIFGQSPVGHIVYTKGGNVIWFFVSDNRNAPVSANLTDAERAHLFRTLAAGSGTYKVDGKRVVIRYEASWHQLWTGTEIANDVDVSGRTLTMTTLPFKSPQDGKDVTVVTTWERLE